MTVVTDTAEVAKIVRLAQAALDRHQPAGYRVLVQPEGVLKGDAWYHVLVDADRDVRTYDFYDVLAEAEAELQDEQKLNVLLVPAIGD